MEIEEVKIRQGIKETEVCPTHLIEDVPSEKDQFESSDGIGPHERVARTMADVILSPTESGGKMIALEGKWGAGKTTVVGLLKNKLVKKDDITVFSYDAWAHEGDPLRRTFLEALIQHLRSISWIDPFESQKTLDEVSNRRSEKYTRTIPLTTKFGRNLAISLFLVPIGSPFLSDSLRRGLTFDLTLPITSISLSFFGGVIFTCAPVWVLLRECFRILWPRWKARKDRDKPWYRAKSDTDEVYAWSFFQGKAITETTQLTIKTPDPTSIEFEKYFRMWMNKALERHSNRKIIMVLDNLDRVDPKDALTIWSTLQTFLQCRIDSTTEEWFRKLWIVIPYDPEGLHQLWTNRGKEEGTPPANDSQIVPESFMDKSFQLRFKVPPPVLSNWKTYLERLTLQALPQHTHEEVHKIYQVFKLTRAKDNPALTPRELKLYVNQIEIIHRQWQHVFPLDHIAYFAILCRRGKPFLEGLVGGQLPDPGIQGIVSPGLIANLAGLYFNVTADLGQQLLLAGPITNAMREANAEFLKKLEMTNHDGLWAVLDSVMTEGGAGATAKEVSNTAVCLDSLGILGNQAGAEKSAILGELDRSARNVETWAPFDESIAKGILVLCRLLPDKAFSEHVLS